MTQPESPKISPEHILASSILRSSALEASKVLASFSGWLLAGFGATLAFVIGNLDSISKYIDTSCVVAASRHLVWAAGLALVAKYLSVLVVAGCEGGIKAGAIVDKYLAQSRTDGRDLSFEVLFQEIEKAIFYPARWYVRRVVIKVRGGDIVSGSRSLMKVAQVQGVLIIAQTVFHLLSASALIRGLAA